MLKLALVIVLQCLACLTFLFVGHWTIAESKSNENGLNPSFVDCALEHTSNDGKERQDLLGDSLPPSALVRLARVRFRFEGEIFALAYSPDSTLLAACNQDYTVIWDATSGKELHRIRDQKAIAVDFSPDTKTLVTTYGGEIFLWNVGDGKQLAKFGEADGHFSWNDRVLFSPDGKLLPCSTI